MQAVSRSCPAERACGSYVRREPEKSVLHVIVREHLETFFAVVREERGKDLPYYVENELRRYLDCGILARGFLRVVCTRCGDEMLVAYSCKCRGACPSCSARRMCGSAAHLVDHVLPDVPLRQWVLTAPYEVRRVLALRPDALTAQNRFFVEEIARWQKQRAAAFGVQGGETGAVTFVQRFDSMLRCFVHLHVVALDGVFTKAEDGALVFHEGPAPSREEIAHVAARVEKRMVRWLRRRKLIDERPAEERSNEPREVEPLEACMQMGLFDGVFLRLGDGGAQLGSDDDEPHAPRGKGPWTAEVGGFNVNAGITVRADDAEGRERLCRYGARPPFSLERLSLLPDGRVAYRLRRPRRNGATHLVMTPVSFLARVAGLIPPPRFPLLRLSGVLGPNAPWRAAVVVYGRGGVAAAKAAHDAPKRKRRKGKEKEDGNAAAILVDGGARRDEVPEEGDVPRSSPGRTSLGSGVVQVVGARFDWARLLRRVYLEDVLAALVAVGVG